MKNQWKIKESDAGARLDVFLAEKLTDTTRSAIAKKLKAGAGFVNNKKATVHAFLKVGDKVEFRPSLKHEPDLSAPSDSAQDDKRGSSQDAKGRKRPFKDVKSLIVKETPDWMVINKPAGILVHPDANEQDGTLVDLLIAHYPPLAKIGEDPSRPGIVHRLDREVSGLMVVAKTQDAFDGLKKQFAQRKTQKYYLALVHGAPPQDEGEIKFRIGRSKTEARMAAIPVNSTDGKAAWSHYKIIKKKKNFTLLEVQIMSGRTHQIRAHLFALNCPIVGDQLYIKQNSKFKIQNSNNRLMLQSYKMSFIDPKTGKEQAFELKPDPMFASFFEL
ncbi:MAG: RluA family pseudouridine synthase [Patescibacteria group bacterium]